MADLFRMRQFMEGGARLGAAGTIQGILANQKSWGWGVYTVVTYTYMYVHILWS